MAFSEDVIAQAWRRARGHCECDQSSHTHEPPCGRVIVWNFRGRNATDAWEADHVSGEDDALVNCQLRCWPCHTAA